MARNGVTFTRDSAKRIVRAVKRVEGTGYGQMPPPRRARVVGTRGGAMFRGARVTTAITAAADNLAANWGAGEARLLDDASGAEQGDPVAVANPLQVAFDVDYWVLLDASHTPPRVVNGSCGAWNWAE